jgi:hypothetical protein
LLAQISVPQHNEKKRRKNDRRACPARHLSGIATKKQLFLTSAARNAPESLGTFAGMRKSFLRKLPAGNTSVSAIRTKPPESEDCFRSKDCSSLRKQRNALRAQDVALTCGVRLLSLSDISTPAKQTNGFQI